MADLSANPASVSADEPDWSREKNRHRSGLRRRWIPVWLVTHSRTREEVSRLYPGDKHIHYIEDTGWHRAMWRIGKPMPAQIPYIATGFLSLLSTRLARRKIVRRLVRENGIAVVHQPMPGSPREETKEWT